MASSISPWTWGGVTLHKVVACYSWRRYAANGPSCACNALWAIADIAIEVPIHEGLRRASRTINSIIRAHRSPRIDSKARQSTGKRDSAWATCASTISITYERVNLGTSFFREPAAFFCSLGCMRCGVLVFSDLGPTLVGVVFGLRVRGIRSSGV